MIWYNLVLSDLWVENMVNWLCTSIQCGGTLPHDGLSVPRSSVTPQVESVVAVSVQVL